MATSTSTIQILFCSLILLMYVSVLGSATTITCSSCQGTAGSSCDVTPWETVHTTPCNGKCVTWRSTYATGRALRTVWRGCEDNVFPAVLGENYRDTCAYGNFFVECTRTCASSLCNKNHTGIPRCWNCLGDHQSCDLAPPVKCGVPIITTTPPPPTTKLECIACQGEKGEMCDVAPFRSTDMVLCDETCVTRKTLLASNRSSTSVWRGCTDTLFPGILHPAALDSCDDVSDNWHVECTSTCSEHRCNKYSTGFTDCWTTEGRRKSSCPAGDENTQESFQPDLLNVDLNDTEQPIPVTESPDDLPLGTLLNCTECQGAAGSECDLTPFQITQAISCTGSCITRRKLFVNGRKLRYVWRGCDQTLFPHVLDERFRNRCQYGNFFVDCTDACRTGDWCNQNSTGIPKCWDCMGDIRSCDVEQEERCDDPVDATTVRPPHLIQCISCSSEVGGSCDISPHLEPLERCTSSCVTSKTLPLPDRTLSNVWRGCRDNMTVAPNSINLCVELAESQKIVCSTNCYDSWCNKYTPGIPYCWTERAELKAECVGTTVRVPNHLINPSRVTTKKPYSIQDALGGDNYHGEWRPTSTDIPITDEEENNSTTKWKRNYEWDGPFFGQSYNAATTDDIRYRLALLLISAMMLVYHIQ